MGILNILFIIFIFPGFLFLVLCGLLLEWMDRKLVARLQNRIGPPWFQPVADLIKLFAKEDITPEKADALVVTIAPIFALAAVLTSALFVPVFVKQALFFFTGDIVIVAYLLSIPTFAIFLGGWYSVNYFSSIGAMRTTLLFFSYEVPLLMSILGPALLSSSWEIQKIVQYQATHGWMAALQPLGFVVALIALVGKLERIPFDIPEAETEIVEGPLCEFSGRKLALFRLMFDLEMVIGAALIVVLFLGGINDAASSLSYLYYSLKVLAVVFILAAVKASFARIRIDQMVEFCWKWLMPLAVLQILIIVIMKIWS